MDAEEPATIQAVDDPESTFYVLRQPGLPPVFAHWPQFLYAIRPDAVEIAAFTGTGM